MAGSRLEKFGTIFTRIKGLLTAGALKPFEMPIWVDVYQRFPPSVEPLYERPVPEQDVQQILYPEDLIRAEFYNMYQNPDVINLNNESVKTSCQKFVEKYFELMKSGTPTTDLFTATAESLKQDGIRLITYKEIKQIKKQTETTGESDQV